MEAMYTAGESADEWIIRTVRETSNPRTLVVVSDDHGIQLMIRGTGGKSIGSRDFIRPTARRPARRSSENLDEIMEELTKKWV
jgi:predicted RNA-binding protein with PIN domain